MSDFFHGWRRKAGCVLLVMAGAMAFAWVRSVFIVDEITFAFRDRQLCIFSFGSQFILLSQEVGDTAVVSWSSFPLSNIRDPESFMLYIESLQPNLRMECTLNYGIVAVPLTILSACLILWPGKRPDRKVKAPVEGQ